MNTPSPAPILPRLIFASRWLQLPLYLGLIVAQGVYVVLFWEELIHLMQILWKPELLPQIAQAMGIDNPAGGPPKSKETIIMLIVLGLIDVVMISNLLIMVIIGGYETFVSPHAPQTITPISQSGFRTSTPMY